MKRMTGGILVLATIMATGAADLTAQRGRRGQQGPAMGGQRGVVEAIMRMKDRLELTDAQMDELDGLRQASVQQRTGQMAMIAELRSQLASGQIDRAGFREAMKAQREGNQESAVQQRERVESILTESQRATLTETRGRARAFAAGRTSMRRGHQGPLRREMHRQGRRGRDGALGKRMRRGRRPVGDLGPPPGAFGPR